MNSSKMAAAELLASLESVAAMFLLSEIKRQGLGIADQEELSGVVNDAVGISMAISAKKSRRALEKIAKVFDNIDVATGSVDIQPMPRVNPVPESLQKFLPKPNYDEFGQ